MPLMPRSHGIRKGASKGHALIRAVKRSCHAHCARWGVAELRAVSLAGTHPEAFARGSERWHVHLGECAVVIHLSAGAWRAIG